MMQDAEWTVPEILLEPEVLVDRHEHVEASGQCIQHRTVFEVGVAQHLAKGGDLVVCDELGQPLGNACVEQDALISVSFGFNTVPGKYAGSMITRLT